MLCDDFIFSIVIAVYNTEKYLEEAIESIINQTFDFEKIQIILVDDGSTDNSREICLKYVKRYPNNIYYLYQENEGQAEARNLGMQLVTGKYVNFLDSDDKLELNACQEVYNIFRTYDEYIDVTVLPRYYFGASNAPHFLNYKYNQTRIVDINDEYDFPQLSISSAFIKKEAITDRFDSRLLISEDSLLINKTILKKNKYGVISTSKYLYRKRLAQNSTIDTKKYKKEYFIQRIEHYFKELINYSISNYGEVIKYIQTVLMYDLQWFFIDNTHENLTKKELKKFKEEIKNILQYIDDNIILSQKFLTKPLEYYALSLKYDKPEFKKEYNSNNLILSYKNNFFDNITNHQIILDEIEIKKDLLYLKGYFDTYLPNNSIKAYNNDKRVTLIKIKGKNEYSLNDNITKRYHFITLIELEKNNKIHFEMTSNSQKYPIRIKQKSTLKNIKLKEYSISINQKNNNKISPKTKKEIKQETLKLENKNIEEINKFEKEILKINTKPKVSLIIPVYNPGKLLHKCLDSIINQTLKNIEIICIDDGSTDNSKEILANYKKKDKRFNIIHQKNQGAGYARNKGINKANGEYILFIDSDDWIEKNTCEELYYHAKNLKTELIIFDALWHTPDKITNFSYFPGKEFKKNYKEHTFDYNLIKHKIMIGSLGVIWSKFYKTEFIKENNIKFPKHKIYNDVEFHFKTTLLSKTIGFLPKKFYHYNRLGQPSLQTTFREGKDELLWFDVLDGLHTFIIKEKLWNDMKLDFINFTIYYTFGKLENINPEYQQTFIKKFSNFLKKIEITDKELKQLKTTKLTGYSTKTTEYLEYYDEIITNKFDFKKITKQ